MRRERAIEAVIEKRRNIGIRLSILARLMRNNFDRLTSKLSITRSQWQMIAVVARHPGATQRFIAETLEMSEASAGRLIDRLCADGMLTRRERDDDRRARAIYLTQAAEPVLAKLAEIGAASEDMLFKGFSSQELDMFEDFVDRMYANLNR